MTGSEADGTDLSRHAKQGIKFNVGIAIGAGDGSAAGKILIDEGADDFGFELVFEIDHVVRKIEMLSDALGVVYVVDGAAAVLCRAGGLQRGEAALIPELHGETDDGAVLFLHQRGDYRAVDAAAHGYGDDLGVLVSCAVHDFGLECDGHGFLCAIDIVLEKGSGSAFAGGGILLQRGARAPEENYYE